MPEFDPPPTTPEVAPATDAWLALHRLRPIGEVAALMGWNANDPARLRRPGHLKTLGARTTLLWAARAQERAAAGNGSPE